MKKTLETLKMSLIVLAPTTIGIILCYFCSITLSAWQLPENLSSQYEESRVINEIRPAAMKILDDEKKSDSQKKSEIENLALKAGLVTKELSFLEAMEFAWWKIIYMPIERKFSSLIMLGLFCLLIGYLEASDETDKEKKLNRS